jgi:hypothetical protein
MNLALAYSSADTHAAKRWLEHTGKWDQSKHDLFILPAKGCEVLPKPDGWRSVTFLKDELGIRSNWHTNDPMRDARGPNSAFRQMARHFYEKHLGPFFWCEPDCIPLYDGWLDDVEAEYQRGGKPFMGVVEMRPFRHVTGNAVYPESAALEQLLILPGRTPSGREIAFDSGAASAMLPKCHFTPLIQHVFRGPAFTSREDFDARVSKGAALYHSCKDGSIYQFLEAESAQPTPIVPLGTNQPGGAGASPAEFAGSHSVKKHPESPGAEEQKPATKPRRKKGKQFKMRRNISPELKEKLRQRLAFAREKKKQKQLAA